MKVTFSRWPWQWYLRPDPARGVTPEGRKYGWRCRVLLGRFGGGWNWKLGIAVGGSCVIIDALFGSVRVAWK